MACRSGYSKQADAVLKRQAFTGLEPAGDIRTGRSTAEAWWSTDAHRHEPQRPRARPVELGQKEALPLPQHHFPAAHLNVRLCPSSIARR